MAKKPITQNDLPARNTIPLRMTLAQLRDPAFNFRAAWELANPHLNYQDAVDTAHDCGQFVKDRTQISAKSKGQANHE